MDTISLGKLVVTPKHIPLSSDEPTFRKVHRFDNGIPMANTFFSFETRAIEKAVEDRAQTYNFVWDCQTQKGMPRPFGIFGNFPPILEFLPLVNPGDIPRAPFLHEKKAAVEKLFEQVKQKSGLVNARALDDAAIKMFGNTPVSVSIEKEMGSLDRMNIYSISATLVYEGFTLIPRPLDGGPDAALLLILPSAVDLVFTQTGTCHEIGAKDDGHRENEDEGEGEEEPFDTEVIDLLQKPKRNPVVLRKRVMIPSIGKEATKLRKGWRRQQMEEMKQEREELERREKSAAERVKALGD